MRPAIVGIATALSAVLIVGSEAVAQMPMSERSIVSGPTRSDTAESDAQPGRVANDRTSDRGRRYWVRDRHRYSSPWYAGERRKMINFGCTKAPYYDPTPRCRGGRGFHHGLDIAMPCRTGLYAGLNGRIVRPSASGSLGSAYGPWAFRIRNRHVDRDFVIGHVRKVFVRPGERVARGQLIARASDAGAPDGCHLHFEARPISGSYDSAVRPDQFLQLSR